jgi:translation initiation factor 3 subunit D
VCRFEEIPFSPFNKGDKLGRVSDWNASRTYRDRFTSYGTGGSAFAYKADDDEGSYKMVDNRPKPRLRFKLKKKYQPNRRNNWQNRNQQWRGQRGRGRGKWNQNRFGRRRYGHWAQHQEKEPSIHVRDDWTEMGSITLAELAEAHLPVPPASTILECGKLERYSNSFDRIIPKTAVTLQSYKKRQRFTATTSADPVLQRLMKEKAGNVFATDTILACLMASPRSVNSWDLVVRKHNGQIIFDNRPNSKISYSSLKVNWKAVQQSDL